MGLSKISTLSFTTTVLEIKFIHRAAEPFSLNTSVAQYSAVQLNSIFPHLFLLSSTLMDISWDEFSQNNLQTFGRHPREVHLMDHTTTHSSFSILTSTCTANSPFPPPQIWR
jgi:hypothetical protein